MENNFTLEIMSPVLRKAIYQIDDNLCGMQEKIVNLEKENEELKIEIFNLHCKSISHNEKIM